MFDDLFYCIFLLFKKITGILNNEFKVIKIFQNYLRNFPKFYRKCKNVKLTQQIKKKLVLSC